MEEKITKVEMISMPNITLYKLDSFLNGDIDEVINALITADQAEKMKAMGNTDSM